MNVSLTRWGTSEYHIRVPYTRGRRGTQPTYPAAGESRDFRSTCTLFPLEGNGDGAGEVLPRKVERKPGCGERPPWPVGPSQTVRRTGRCRGRSPPCCRRHQLRHRRRQLPRPLRPCTASRRPRAPTDLGNPGCTEKMQEDIGLFYIVHDMSSYAWACVRSLGSSGRSTLSGMWG